MDLFFVRHSIIIPIKFGNIDISISNFSLSIFGLAMVLFGVLSLFLVKSQYKPNIAQNIAETLFEKLSHMFYSYVGEKGAKYIPFLFSLMLFITIVNLGNLIPGIFTCTSQLFVTATLSFMVFILVTMIGIYEHRAKFWSLFIPSGIPTILKPLLFCLELFSFCMRPLSLALRLSINMLAGHIMLHVIASFSKDLGNLKILTVLVSTILSMFEIGIAALQAYVFAVLSSIYIADIMKEH
jgi:F-type H+-transporting ATPase subunit a